MVVSLVGAARSHGEATVRGGTAWSRVPIQAAILVVRRKRQTASNDHGRIPLPASYEQVHRSRAVAKELLAPAKRQLINRRQNQDAIAVEILTSVPLTQIRLIAAIVVIGPRVSIGPIEGQAERGAMVHLDLQRFVRIDSVVAPVIEAISPAAYHVGRYAVGVSVGGAKGSIVG